MNPEIKKKKIQRLNSDNEVDKGVVGEPGGDPLACKAKTEQEKVRKE